MSQFLHRIELADVAYCAHQEPIRPPDAQELIWALCGRISVKFGGDVGWAFTTEDSETISIPERQDRRPDGVPYSRVGVVLHECAHVLAERQYGPDIEPHGLEFCETFGEILFAYDRYGA